MTDFSTNFFPLLLPATKDLSSSPLQVLPYSWLCFLDHHQWQLKLDRVFLAICKVNYYNPDCKTTQRSNLALNFLQSRHANSRSLASSDTSVACVDEELPPQPHKWSANIAARLSKCHAWPWLRWRTAKENIAGTNSSIQWRIQIGARGARARPSAQKKRGREKIYM